MWGNGRRFGLDNSSTFPISGDKFLLDISFVDIDSDGFKELVISGFDQTKGYYVEIYKSDDKGKSWVNRTAQYFDNNISTKRFDHIRVQDIDKNGRVDIFAPDKKDNVRWEWTGVKFI